MPVVQAVLSFSQFYCNFLGFLFHRLFSLKIVAQLLDCDHAKREPTILVNVVVIRINDIVPINLLIGLKYFTYIIYYHRKIF